MFDSAVHHCERYRCGALDVVVEAEYAIPETLENWGRVFLGEVFPLEQHVGPTQPDLFDELLDEGVIVGLFNAVGPLPEVTPVRQALVVVGADIEHDRQGPSRVDSTECRVEAELANGDAHAANALVTESEDALAIGRHDDIDRAGDRLELLAHPVTGVER